MTSKQPVIIAGGTGFIGRRLAAQLAADRVPVVILTRREARDVEGVRFVRWEPATSGDWQACLDGAAAVVNLCGEIIAGKRWTETRKRELTDSRVVPTRALVGAIEACTAPPLLLQASGVGYYGTGEAVRDESGPAGDDFLARLAVAWEAPLADLNSRSLVLRFGVVLGRGGGALGQMLLPFRTFLGGPIGSGKQWLSWIHLDDAVAAIRHLLEQPNASGPYNITAPQPVRNVEFAETAGKVLGRPVWVPLPKAVMTALLGEQALLVCEGQQAMPKALQQSGFEFSFPTLEAALTDLT